MKKRRTRTVSTKKAHRKRRMPAPKRMRTWVDPLTDSERLLRLVLNNVNDLVVVLDLQGRRLYNSPSYKEILGDPEILRGTDSFAEIHPEDRDHIRQIFEETVSTGVGQRAEFRFMLKDGTVRYIESQGNLVRSESGEPEKVVVVSRDITESRESEQRLRLLANTITCTKDCISITNLEEMILFVNEAFLDTYGYAEDELLGKNIAMVRSPSMPSAMGDQIFHGTLAGGWNGEVLHRRKDGTDIPLELWSSVVKNEDGDPVAMVGVARDITERKRTMEALRESEERYRRLVELTPDAIFVHSDGRFVFVNSAGVRLLGASEPGQLLGKKILEFVHPDYRNAVRRRVEQLTDRGEGVPTKEEKFLRLDGTEVDVEVAAIPLLFQGKSSVQVVARDITERKRVEDEVSLQKERFQQLFENTPLGIVMLDENDVILQTNKAFEKIFQYTMSEVRGRTINDLVVPPQYGLEGSELSRKTQIGESADTDTIRRRKDGSLVHVHVYGVPTNIGGKLAGIYGIYQDVTERIRADEKIREQAALLDIAHDAIVVRDLEGNILFWNRSSETLYGYLAEEAVGRNAEMLYAEKERERRKQAIESVLKDGSWTGELRQRTKIGKEVIVQSRWSLVRDNAGNPKSVLVVATDITERKKLEIQSHRAQRLEIMGTLAGGIAHDLNNVLAPILMAIELLQTKNVDEKSMRLLSTIETGARRGADIVKQVLTFARGIEGERALLQPRHLIKEMERIIQETFPKSIEFQSDIQRDLWEVSGDATQLHQILMNLCVNARDAMPRGGVLGVRAQNVRLDSRGVRIHQDARPGPYVAMTVADTGVGIPEEYMEKIFDPFFTTKEVGKGTGLGLSTVMGIVRSHGGFLTVKSEVGQGTEFRVFLPAAGERATGTAKVSGRERPVGSGEFVLVIDDEASIREITRDMLEAHGYRVLVAKDGIEAVTVYEQHREDIRVVLTDLMMPNLDGASVIRLLQRMNSNVKIIAASGLAEDGGAAESVKPNVQGFLVKPYKAEELLIALEKVLR